MHKIQIHFSLPKINMSCAYVCVVANFIFLFFKEKNMCGGSFYLQLLSAL